VFTENNTVPSSGKSNQLLIDIVIDISAAEYVAMFVKSADRVPFCTHHFRPEKWNSYPQFRKNEAEILR
jgi:hypothetical protein